LRRQCAPARLEKKCAILDGLCRRATAGQKKSGLHVRGTHRS
jgi:hypothetical protein